MEVSVTDFLFLFLTKIYVLVFSAFNILFLEKQRETEFYRYTCLNRDHHSNFSQQREWVTPVNPYTSNAIHPPCP